MGPSDTQRSFFERYVFGKKGVALRVQKQGRFVSIEGPFKGLLLTIKTPGGSVNIEGDFEFKEFRFKNGQLETVIQPDWAQEREGVNETNVHMHVQWDVLKYVRVWYQGTPHIDQDARICFFANEPREGERGEELFWFYAFREGESAHPLCQMLPASNNSRFSRVASLDELITEFDKRVLPAPNSAAAGQTSGA